MFNRSINDERRSNLTGKFARRTSRRDRGGRPLACEPLERRILLTALTITGTSGNDYISLAGSGGSLIQVDVNAVITNYNPFDYTSVTIQGVGGNDTINILGTELPTTVVGAGQDTIMVGDTNGVQDITASVNVTDPPFGDYADLTINDSADATARNASVSDTSVTNLAPATISYSQQDLRSFTVNGGSGGNTFTVTSTPSGFGTTATQLNTGTGSDTVNIQATSSDTLLNLQGQNGHDTVGITNAGSAQGIAGGINIENDGGFDALTIDDSADATARTATYSTFTPGGDTAWESLIGLAPASIDYEGQDINSATFDGGTAGNSFNVFGLAPGFNAGVPTTINTGTGADHVNLQTTAAGTVLNVQGQNGLDTVNVTSGGSVQGIKGTVNIENTGSFTGITVDDSSDTTPRTASFGTFTPTVGSTWESLTGLAPGTINYKTGDVPGLFGTGLVSNVTVNGGTGGNTFAVNDLQANLNLNTGTGADLVNVVGISNLGTLNLQGQNGADTVNITNAGSIQGITGRINIKNDAYFDTLTIDDSADTSPLTALLSTVTPVSDSIYGSLAFGTATINFRAADMANPITIKGGSGGNTFNVTGTVDTTNLTTGAGNDQVNIRATRAGTTLNVDGQAGSDTVSVTDSGSVQGVQGIVNIENTLSFDALTVDDSADATPRTATLATFTPAGDSAWESLTGLTPGTINYELADITTATISGGSGGNTFNINSTAAGGGNGITLNTGSGNDVVNVNSTVSATILALTSQGGNDTINLNYVSGNPLPHAVNLNGLFTVNGFQAGRNLNGTTLNINRSTVYFNYGSAPNDPLALIKTYLLTGYNSAAWTGTATASTGAINSSPAAANPNHNTAIGYADSATDPTINTTPNSVELRYTLIGDINLDKSVNITDINALVPHYNGTGNWTSGDFNYDGKINITDVNALVPNYNTNLGSQVQPAASSFSAATPPPKSSPLTAEAVIAASATPGAGVGAAQLTDGPGASARKKRNDPRR